MTDYIMRPILRPAALALALILTAGTAPAQQRDEGIDLMQEGAKIILRSLLRDMGPQISQMQELARTLGDFDQYQMPEVLPNGDVLIRRKVPLMPRRLDPPEEGEIDL